LEQPIATWNLAAALLAGKTGRAGHLLPDEGRRGIAAGRREARE
jgi:hypothetical protein